MDHLELLGKYYYELYGDSGSTKYRYDELMTIIDTAKKNRSDELKKQDEGGNGWYLSEKMVGMMLYLDKFNGDLAGFEEKIPYLADLGITYVHFMPLLKSREGNNDGGYAVADYLKVDERFGDMAQFERIITKLRERGIKTCVDFVLNHTAKEHIWARKSRVREPGFEDMYMMFDDYETVKEYEKTMPEVFPDIAPGSFTYYDDIKKWVCTNFYEFQWDLNYRNPGVFNKIVEVMFELANKGIDIFRLDAIAFMWKEIGTNCRNLPQVHQILKMLNLAAAEVCPSVILKGEAIVEPKEIVKYFGSPWEKECHILYNASLMVLLWSSLATRDVRLMHYSMNINYGTPGDAAWINYVRCHDDIGWGFEDSLLKELGWDPEGHKQFMIQFYEGKFPGSFATGELYSYNPKTKDARTSGTLASLCGLEKAFRERDQYQLELAVKRILLLNAVIISYRGIPMLYSGDELGQMNWWDYKQDESIRMDSRWLHRPPMDWKKAAERNDRSTVHGYLFQKIKEMIAIRKSHYEFAASHGIWCFDTWNKGVFGFTRENKMVVLANFTEYQQTVNPDCLGQIAYYGDLVDLLQGKTVYRHKDIVLGPYEFLWLVGR